MKITEIAFTCYPVTDVARSRAFYEGILGLSVVDESAYAVVLDAHGTMLRVTAVSDVAHPGYTVLGWRVDEMEEAVLGLESVGVVFARFEGMEQDDHGVWATPNGDLVAWFTDPDGNVLSLTEFRSSTAR